MANVKLIFRACKSYSDNIASESSFSSFKNWNTNPMKIGSKTFTERLLLIITSKPNLGDFVTIYVFD